MESVTQQKAGSERSIGAILIDNGRLSANDAERILREQKASNLRFGDAALKLGLLREDDIQYALANQFDYPYLQRGDKSVSEEVIAAFNPTAALTEQIRAVRTQLLLRWFNTDSTHKRISVVSLNKGDGRSFIAANLAVVFSQLGERALLIDADMRNPKQQQLFKIANNHGLSAVLAGRAAASDATIKIDKLLGLSVLPAGALPPNPQELLTRDAFSATLDKLAAEFDIIIVDTPAAADSADTQTIAFTVGAAFLVATNNRTKAGELEQLVLKLKDSNVAIIGAMLNDFDIQPATK